jgi:hypothetical protein
MKKERAVAQAQPPAPREGRNPKSRPGSATQHRQADCLLSGSTQRQDESAAASVSMGMIEAAPCEFDFHRVRAHASLLERDDHVSRGEWHQVIERDRAFVEFYNHDRPGCARPTFLIERRYAGSQRRARQGGNLKISEINVFGVCCKEFFIPRIILIHDLPLDQSDKLFEKR